MDRKERHNKLHDMTDVVNLKLAIPPMNANVSETRDTIITAKLLTVHKENSTCSDGP